jgi:hypothetical protein
MPKGGAITNTTGKGGFGENPQNRSDGRWSKDTSISYWYNYLLRLDIEAFEEFEPKTMAQRLALNAVVEAKDEINYLREVTDRTEGRPSQSTDITTDGKPIAPTSIQVEIVKANEVTSDNGISD